MLTIVETPTFLRLWPYYWSEEERGEVDTWLALVPDASDVVPGSGGVRKVRWSRKGTGNVAVCVWCISTSLQMGKYGCS